MNRKLSLETTPAKNGAEEFRGNNKFNVNLEFIDTDIWEMIRLR